MTEVSEALVALHWGMLGGAAMFLLALAASRR